MSSPIGGFMPIPLAMMIPFMATQSLVMGDAFGKGFQYGKRKISAMSNDEFNELTEVKLAAEMFQAYKNIIPDLQQSIKDSSVLQMTVINTLLQLPFKGLEGILQEIHENLQGKNHHDTKDTIHPDISEKEKAIIKANQENNPPPDEIKSRRDPPPPPPPEASAKEKEAHASMMLAWNNLQSAIRKFKANPKSTFYKAVFLKANTKMNKMYENHKRDFGHYSHPNQFT